MKKNKKFNLLIDKSCNIRSRQWFLKNIKNILKSLLVKIKNKTQKKELIKNSVSILITNDKYIKNLNKKYRKINKPTDVLSFPENKKNKIKNKYLGDIVISINSCKKNAKEKKVSFDEEMILLIIHGYLHLLGYDHINIKDEKKMFNLQNQVVYLCMKK